jgi:N-acetylglucosaminyldiphosphoundecaprenol N-acetyl-beta-D-mannosaminyltransferase
LKSPVLSCRGHHNPGFGSIEDLSGDANLDAINSSRPDFLVVSLGAEKGQAWILRNLGRIEAPVVSHLGASINFLAGTIKRAPLALQNIGLEWAWRIYQEPHLFMRYAKDAAALASLSLTAIVPLRVWLWIGKWKYGTAHFAVSRSAGIAGQAVLKLQGALTRGEAARLTAEFDDAMVSATSISVDLGGMSWLDPYGAGSLLMATAAARRRGIAVAATGAGRFVQTGLNLFGLGEFLTDAGNEGLRVARKAAKEPAQRALDAAGSAARVLPGRSEGMA